MCNDAHVFDKLLTATLPALPTHIALYRSLVVAGIMVIGGAIAWLPPEISAILLGGAIILVLLLYYPVLSLYLLILIIPLSTLLAVPLGGFKAGLMEIVLALGLTAWFLQTATKRYFQKPTAAGPPLRSLPPLLWPFLLLLGSAALSWLNTFSIGASFIETAKWVEMLALFLLLVNLLPHRHLKWVVAVILLTGVGQAALGLYQFIFKVGPEGFLLFDGRFLRAFGTFAQPNPYAGYLGLILPLALSLAIWSFSAAEFRLSNSGPAGFWFKGRLKFSNLSAKILLSLGVALLLVALFASQSRAAWLAFVVAAAVTIVAGNARPGLIITTLISAAALVGLVGAFEWNPNHLTNTPDNTAFGAITQRFIDAATITTIDDISALEVNDANFATIERLAHWQAAREMWRDNPWLGVGFGNYAAIYPVYAVGRWLDPLGHAHNTLLNIGAETGLVGLVGYLIFWIFAFKIGWQATRCSHGFYRAIAAGNLGILVHLHIHNFFDNLYVQGMYLHIAVILAVTSIIHHACQCPVNR